MARPQNRAKTETLSLRLDPKTKFILDFVARARGQSITTIVERAILDMGDNTSIDESPNNIPITWRNFWDANEGIRTINLLLDSRYRTNFDDDEILDFLKIHWPFFFTSNSKSTPMRDFVYLLWPKLDEYLEIWREKRQGDYWAAGNRMAEDLSAAKVKPPSWPPQRETRSAPPPPRQSFSTDLDDEIPF